MRIRVLVPLLALASTSHAQLVYGSFEDAQGNFKDSCWVSTCTAMPGPAAPNWGSYGILVPHSNSQGCGGWSRLYQYVPAIADGETWTLSGWAANFTFFWADPYIGFRFGWKDAGGTLHFNTAALQNTGQWTYLDVTNTFDLEPGDTVFVECDPGTVSGNGDNQVMAMFDGVELVSEPTNVHVAPPSLQLHMRPNPVIDRVWVASEDPLLELRIIGMDGAVERTVPFVQRNGTIEMNVSDLPAGAHLIWARSHAGVSTMRFVKQ
jgi:hypothetical protein